MSTDESGDLGGTVNEKPVQPWLLKIKNISKFGDALKYSAIAGAVIYAGLFLGYRKYYSLLEVRPEDVGVNNTFILVRSIGFIVFAVIGTGLAIGLTSWFHQAFKERHRNRPGRYLLHLAAAGTVWLIVSVCFWKLDAPQSQLAASMGLVLALACIAMAQFSHPSRLDRYIANGGLVVAAITIVLVPVLAAIISAYIRADLVQHGKESTPVTILGIPLLDVSAENVRASWICQDSQRPATFRQPDTRDDTINAILVGETPTSYYLHVGDKDKPPSEIVKLPQNCAVLTHDET